MDEPASDSPRPADPAPQTELAGKFLIAMPGMGDPRFERSVVCLCAHGAEGSMGLIVNKPAADLSFDSLLEQLSIPRQGHTAMPPVHFGGPVETGRGFVLHSDDYRSDGATLDVAEGLAMTATLDVLQALAQGQGPTRALVALGYAGWGAGQLDGELAENAWLIVDAAPEIVFDTADRGKWTAALKALGVDPVLLSAEGGRA